MSDFSGLWAAKEGGSFAARQELIERHRTLVILTRQRCVPNVPYAIDEGDLESEGYVALVRAVDRFEPGREVKFTSFAIALIRGAMLEYLRQEDWVPRSVRNKQKAWTRAEAALLARGEPLTDEQLAAELGVPLRRLGVIEREAVPRARVSWEDVVFEYNDGTPALTHADQYADPAPGPEEELCRREDWACYRQALARLRLPARRIAARYLEGDETLKAIARDWGRSESRVHQLWTEGREQLRAEVTF